MSEMAELICGALTMIAGVGGLIAAYHCYMLHVYDDIAREEADDMFRDYVQNCEYRVHTKIVTEIEVDKE